MKNKSDKKSKQLKPKVRNWKESDIDQLVKCHAEIYSDYSDSDLYGKRIFKLQLQKFPEGQFLVEIGGKIVGYAASIIVKLDDDEATYTYTEITGGGAFTTHNISGDTLYGADIGIHPDYRRQGLSALLYEARIKLLKKFNLKRMVAHGRIPGYKEYAGKYSAERYVELVSKGKLNDPALKAHIKAGYKVKKVLLDFVRDKSSMNYATWLELKNPDFDKKKHMVGSPALKKAVRRVRVCAGQFEMKKIDSWNDFEQSVEFFVDSAKTYHSHFLLLPEYFTAQLFSTFDPNLNDRQAIQKLSELTDKYKELLIRKAKESKLFIIGGSHPVKRDGEIFNVAHLFSPSGKVYEQDKLHITPSERRDFNIQAGQGINVFDTQYGKIAIQVCYDIEFPEVSRLLTLAGVEIIFVPFSTDERKAYNRVRRCAFARAIENYVYVVIAGNVGNLPSVKSYLVNYGQAAIITPSDFAFPTNSLEGEADPNTETVVVADLDLTTLHSQREIGSVRPLFDMRNDLYEIHSKVPINTIKVT
ncbi:MAG: GNAT family N-acetyltransferase [Deltaproteobacteria bacterium]|nr:MAG: GNAT family N-acetyltransferase [Deltaproteobacteria bacterium]TNF26925.1 MAG: GNAT family N-acetyltransferase [Deltaproteobacteria bacterium]